MKRDFLRIGEEVLPLRNDEEKPSNRIQFLNKEIHSSLSSSHSLIIASHSGTENS